MVRKMIQNRMKVEILIFIRQVMMNSVQFSARMNIEMTQKKLFEIFILYIKRIEKNVFTMKNGFSNAF